MTSKVITVDFDVRGKNEEDIENKFREFLTQAYMNFAATYDVLDYEYIRSRHGSNNK